MGKPFKNPLFAKVLHPLIKTAVFCMALPPLGYCLSLLIFYFSVAVDVGHLPTYGNPDPKYTGLYDLYAPTVNRTFEWSVFMVVPWLLLALVSIPIMKRRIDRIGFAAWQWLFPLAFGAGCYVSAALVTFSGVFSWYVD